MITWYNKRVRKEKVKVMKLYTRLVKNMLSELGYKNVKVRNAENLSSDMKKQIIYLDPKWLTNNPEISNDKKLIAKLYREYGWKIKASMNIFSILHELGHLVSASNFQDLDHELDKYEMDNYFLELSKITGYKQFQIYRKFKLERHADRIAYQIYKKNKDLIAQYDQALAKITR